MDLVVGATIGERYRLVSPLAEGGMGSIWVGEDRDRKQPVAIKILAQDPARNNEEMRARFAREAKATAQLDSEHVVSIHHYGVVDDGTAYIVMDLLAGEDLGQRLDRSGALDLDTVVAIVEQTCIGLGAAHRANIVHRDIKPDNIFLSPRDDGGDHVKLLDFGIAKQTGIEPYSLVTATGTMLGTPSYMSPEQVMTGSKVDLRSDLWSVGVVAYHALTGQTPFDGETLGALCVAISQGSFEPPSVHSKSLPDAVDRWMVRALALEPSERFETAQELAASLRDAASGIPPSPPNSLAGAAVSGRIIVEGDAATRTVNALSNTVNATPARGSRGRAIVAVLVVAGLLGVGILVGRSGVGPAAPAPGVSAEPSGALSTAAPNEMEGAALDASAAPVAAAPDASASADSLQKPSPKTPPAALAATVAPTATATAKAAPSQTVRPPPRVKDRGF